MYFLRQFASINKKNNLIVQRLNVYSKSNDLNVEQLERFQQCKFSTDSNLNKEICKLSENENERLNPSYVTGIADADSTFYLRFVKRGSNRTG